MTTAQIEAYADPTSAATGDFNEARLKIELRHHIIPEFMEDVGYAAWRRKHETATLALGARYIDIPSVTFYFGHMKEVYVSPCFEKGQELPYIGEEPNLVLAAKATTTTGKPTAFYMEQDGSRYTRVGFNVVADAAYTIAYSFDLHVQFEDDDADVDLNIYIPTQFQWGLVEGLNREIRRVRMGIGDPQFQASAQEFERWKQRARKSPELAQRTRSKFAR